MSPFQFRKFQKLHIWKISQLPGMCTDPRYFELFVSGSKYQHSNLFKLVRSRFEHSSDSSAKYIFTTESCIYFAYIFFHVCMKVYVIFVKKKIRDISHRIRNSLKSCRSDVCVEFSTFQQCILIFSTMFMVALTFVNFKLSFYKFNQNRLNRRNFCDFEFFF